MNSNIVRAWKDEFYRQSLSDEERAQLPENPVGELDLTDAELESVFAAGEGHGNNRISIDHNRCESFYCPTHNFVYACQHHSTAEFYDCSYRYNLCHNFSRSHSRECYPYDKDKH